MAGTVGSHIGSIGLWFPEHENLNSYRNYPFSEASSMLDDDGAELAADVFVDAYIYPIVSRPSRLKLHRILAASSEIEVRVFGDDPEGDETDEDIDPDSTLKGYGSSSTVELYDSRGRHAGTIVCGKGWDREVASGRERVFSNVTFSSFTCCPVIHTGVLSLANEWGTERTSRRHIIFKGDAQIKPHLVNGPKRKQLYFDAIPLEEQRTVTPIRRMVFANSGKTLFHVSSDGSQGNKGTVFVTAPLLDREDVCWQAHKEDSVSTVADVCEEEAQEPCDKGPVPVDHGEIIICVDPMGNVSILADSTLNYKNPVVINTVGGVVQPREMSLSDKMSQDDVLHEGAKLTQKPIRFGNGIKISIPGLQQGE